jgi:serine phosphatase RsbU (regulator of sigma subunit)
VALAPLVTTPAPPLTPPVEEVINTLPPFTPLGHRPARAERGPGSAVAPLAAAPATTPAAPPAPAPARARLVPLAAISAAPAEAAGGGRPATASHQHGSPKHSASSPLVTTITKIVKVVPTPVWILVGALLALATALGLRSLVAALRNRKLERQRAELLEDVGLLQAALLPILPARLGPVGTSAAYRPAAGPGAGGDFYDLFALDDGQLAIIVGDVSGHGRQALPHTALVRFTLRAYLEAGLSPRVALKTAGPVLERQLGGSFVTVVLATYQPRERILTYACAGHPHPLVLAGSDAITPITACSSPPIGTGMRTGTRQTVVSMPGSSQAFFYTDGVTEARVGRELFGVERLSGLLSELGPEATAAELLDRVAQATDRRPDDMAACLLDLEGAAGAPKVLVEELELDRDEAMTERTEQFLRACGVAPAKAAEVMRSAQAIAARSGTVLIELRLRDGQPEITLRRDNVAVLHTPSVPPQAALGASR